MILEILLESGYLLMIKIEMEFLTEKTIISLNDDTFSTTSFETIKRLAKMFFVDLLWTLENNKEKTILDDIYQTGDVYSTTLFPQEETDVKQFLLDNFTKE